MTNAQLEAYGLTKSVPPRRLREAADLARAAAV
jgi:hypothetical protein